MNTGIPKESLERESRIAVVPKAAKELKAPGYELKKHPNEALEEVESWHC